MIIVNANLIPQVGRNNKTIKNIFYLTLALSDDVGGEKRLTSGLREKLFPDKNSQGEGGGSLINNRRRRTFQIN